MLCLFSFALILISPMLGAAQVDHEVKAPPVSAYFTDYDGTIGHEKDADINPILVQHLHTLMNNDIKIFVTTSRKDAKDLKKVFANAFAQIPAYEIYFIYGGGAGLDKIIFKDGQLRDYPKVAGFNHKTISGPDILRLSQIVAKFFEDKSGFYTIFDNKKEFIAHEGKSSCEWYMVMQNPDNITAKAENYSDAALNFMFPRLQKQSLASQNTWEVFSKNLRQEYQQANDAGVYKIWAQELQQIIDEEFGQDIFNVIPNERSLDITPCATKEDAMAQIVNLGLIQPGIIIATGDGLNDINMLKAAQDYNKKHFHISDGALFVGTDPVLKKQFDMHQVFLDLSGPELTAKFLERIINLNDLR